MNRIIFSLLRQLLFWLLFFALARFIFMMHYLHLFRVSGAGWGEVISLFYHALPLDVATAGYFLMFPFVLLMVQSFVKLPVLNTVNKIYTGFIILFYTLITTGEMGIYGEWKTKLNIKALRYLQNPSEVYDSAETGSFFLLLLTTIGLFALGYWAYTRLFFLEIKKPARNKWLAIPVLIITLGLFPLAMRGGLQEIPINQSQSYFSPHIILNQTATNNAFNIAISLIENTKSMTDNPYKFYDPAIAKKTVENIYKSEKDTTVSILNTSRPNIVLLILESWSADLIESLGGEPGITPEFRQLEEEGILFTGMLSTGSRSEQGMAAIFSGFPAHALTSITVQPDKFIHLPTITRELNELGYHSSFYFGGQLIYGNIKSYILYNEFDRVREGADFDDSLPRGKLGIHDEYTMAKVINDMNTEKEPFFTALFTLSSHSPYDQPMREVFDWGDNERRYINSAYYTDSCLGVFMREARKYDWYDNTLFVMVADHSHNSYRNWPFASIEYHRIPMLWYGEVIKPEYRGSQNYQPGSQVDLSASLLVQLNLPHEEFHWSRNLFNPYSPRFRYFGYENGLIWEEGSASFCYDCDHKTIFWKKPAKDFDGQVIQNGMSYLQVLFQEYFDY
ncbi:MAG: LTA synthase family protein [Bacteroidales bacterium]